MSGTFDPDQQQSVESTDDPELAKRYGLVLDKKTGLYAAPKAPDAGQRDGDDVQERRRLDAKAEGDAQHEAEHGEHPDDAKARRLGGEGDDVTEHDERTPGAPNVAGETGEPVGDDGKTDEPKASARATKATSPKASGNK